jgi:hypothetical protein
VKPTSTMHRGDRQLLSLLADLEPEQRASILARLGEHGALRDVGADLTIHGVRDVLEYAPRPSWRNRFAMR